jgi:putative ABC transport system substrate-binding protein
MTAKMKRRDFITLLGGAAAWPLAARAQQGGDAGGWVLATIEPYPIRLCGLPRWLKAHGYESGRNIRIEPRFASL